MDNSVSVSVVPAQRNNLPVITQLLASNSEGTLLDRVLFPSLPAGVSAALDKVTDSVLRPKDHMGRWTRNGMTKESKRQFVQSFITHNLKFIETCQVLQLSPYTVKSFINRDPYFKEALRLAGLCYIERVEGVSRAQALDPKGVIDRMFQLKHLRPDVYGDKPNVMAVQINMDSNGVR